MPTLPSQQRTKSPQRPAPPSRLVAWVIAWGPVALLMAAIFIASAQPKLPPAPGSAGAVYFTGWMPVFAGSWDFVVKKSAHVLCYGTLSLLTLRALRRMQVPPGRASLVALAIAVSYGLTDELHQSLVPGRTASPLDLGFDAAGAAGALLLVRWWQPNQQQRAPVESTRALQRERAVSSTPSQSTAPVAASRPATHQRRR